jgi:hypothetical protein
MLGAALAFAATVAALWQVYTDTIPAATLRQVSPQAPYLMPFLVENRSSIFDMREAKFDCLPTHATVQMVHPNADNPTFGINLFDPVPHDPKDRGVTIINRHPLNYPCDLTNVVVGEQMAMIQNGVPRVVQTELASVELSFRMTYKTRIFFWDIPRRWQSPVYRGAMTTYGFQWVEGDIVGGPN